VGVVMAAVSRSAVEVLGPGVGQSGVAGELDHRVAQLLVHAPPERDHRDLAGLSGGGSDPGQTGQRLGGGEPSAGVADLGEQPGGAHGAGAREAGEDVPVDMDRELLADHVRQRVDLGHQAEQTGDQGSGDVHRRRTEVPARSARGCGDPGVHRRWWRPSNGCP